MKVWIIVLMFIVSQPASAATLKEISETKSLSNKIMQHFLKTDFVKGINMAKPHWPMPPAELDNLTAQIKTAWKVVQERYGEPTGIELIREENIGQSFARFYYLHKFENHSIYWKFTYYMPRNEWKINGISFKDDLEFLFVVKD